MSIELVEALTRLFPAESIIAAPTDREAWMRAGKAQLVSFLRSTYERQNNVTLETQLVHIVGPANGPSAGNSAAPARGS